MYRLILYILSVVALNGIRPISAEKHPHFIRFQDTCTCNQTRVPCFGYRNAAGDEIAPAVHPWLDADTVYTPHTYVITCDGRFPAIDTAGTVLFEFFPYDNGPDYFSQGLARYIDDGKIGYVDTAYAVAIPAQYDFATPFAHGRAAFCTGCEKVPVYPDHPGADPLEKPEHFRYTGGTWGFIDRNGTVIEPPVPGDVVRFDDSTITVMADGKQTVRHFEPVARTFSGTVIACSEVWDRRPNPLMGRPDVLTEIRWTVLATNKDTVRVSVQGSRDIVAYKSVRVGSNGTFSVYGTAAPCRLARADLVFTPVPEPRTLPSVTKPPAVTPPASKLTPQKQPWDRNGRELLDSPQEQERMVRLIAARFGLDTAEFVHLVSHQGPRPPRGGYVYWGVRGKKAGEWYVWQHSTGTLRKGRNLVSPRRFQK